MYDKYKKTIHHHQQGLLQRPKLQKWGGSGLRWFWKHGLYGLWSGLHLQHETLQHEKWVSKLYKIQYKLDFKFIEILWQVRSWERIRGGGRRRRRRREGNPRLIWKPLGVKANKDWREKNQVDQEKHWISLRMGEDETWRSAQFYIDSHVLCGHYILILWCVWCLCF